MAKIEILGKTFELNMFDAKVSQKVEEAAENVSKKINEMEFEGKRNSEAIIEICQATFECFNYIFGEGTDKKIFGESCDLLKCMDAIGQLIQGVKEEQTKTCNEVMSRYDKYLPNRQTRRKKV